MQIKHALNKINMQNVSHYANNFEFDIIHMITRSILIWMGVLILLDTCFIYYYFFTKVKLCKFYLGTPVKQKDVVQGGIKGRKFFRQGGGKRTRTATFLCSNLYIYHWRKRNA